MLDGAVGIGPSQNGIASNVHLRGCLNSESLVVRGNVRGTSCVTAENVTVANISLAGTTNPPRFVSSSASHDIRPRSLLMWYLSVMEGVTETFGDLSVLKFGRLGVNRSGEIVFQKLQEEAAVRIVHKETEQLARLALSLPNGSYLVSYHEESESRLCAGQIATFQPSLHGTGYRYVGICGAPEERILRRHSPSYRFLQVLFLTLFVAVLVAWLVLDVVMKCNPDATVPKRSRQV
jgi:hypothetical protein